MNDFELYQLDEYHAIGQFVNKNGSLSWQMITTNAPIANGEINADAGFEFCEFNPNDFEWNGRRVRIEIQNGDELLCKR